MATQRESTLLIKDFRGITRYKSTINEEPNKFRTLQNLWSPARGELAVIPGITKVVADGDIPGVAQIIHAGYLPQSFGINETDSQAWVLHYIPTGVTMPSPTGMTYTTQGSNTSTRNVLTEFIGPGGTASGTTATAQQFGSNGLLVTLPTNIPTYVHCIHFYIEIVSGSVSGQVMWAGTAWRRNGFFASSITLPDAGASGVSANTIYEAQPTGFTLEASTGGSLLAGTTYYLGITPWATSRTPSVSPARNTKQVVNFRDSGLNFFAITLPPGKSSIIASFTGIPTSAGDSTPVAYARNVVFIGQSPEDMLPVAGTINGTATSLARSSGDLSVTIRELPVNSNKYAIGSDMTKPSSQYLYTLAAPTGRGFGTWNIFEEREIGNFTADLSAAVGACSIQIPYGVASHRELLPSRQIGSFDVRNFLSGTIRTTASWLTSQTEQIRHDYYENRMIFANGFNSPWYTNGVVLKPIVRDYQTAYTPITKYLTIFKDRLILSGGPENFANTDSLVYPSETANPRSFTATPSATPSWNFLRANLGDAAKIMGLGVCSDSLVDSGVATFLVIGKTRATYLWNGNTSDGVQELDNRIGWASPDAFARTNRGSILATRDGMYKVAAQGLTALPSDVDDILQGLSEARLPYVQLKFVQDRLILGYADQSSIVDRELWLDFRKERDNSVSLVWTGPHVMTTYSGQAIAQNYGTLRNYRASFLGNEIFRRDVPQIHTDNTASIPILIEFQELDFQQPDFQKLLTAIAIRAKINRQETVALSIVGLDYGTLGEGMGIAVAGEQTISESMVLKYAGSDEVNRLFQKFFSRRYRGTIFQPSISLSTNVDFRIVSLSLLYEMERRRML